MPRTIKLNDEELGLTLSCLRMVQEELEVAPTGANRATKLAMQYTKSQIKALIGKFSSSSVCGSPSRGS